MELQHPLGVVTPSVDGDVLAVLARADAAFTTGQVHRVLPAVSQNGIRLSLQRLSEQGIVLADRVGNAYVYRLNREHLAADHVVGLANLMSAFLQRLEGALGAWQPQPAYAAVFGSAARGTMTTESDIDLLLVRPDGADEDAWDEQAQDLASRATRWTGNDVRALLLDEADLNPDEPVLRDVLAHGLTVAGTRDWLARRLRRTRTPA
jgi:hypothetical protein